MNTLTLTAVLYAVLVGKSYAGTAAGVLFPLANHLNDAPPNIWEIISRILSALADIIKAWPGGVPLNAKDILLAIFKATVFDELAPKIDQLMQKLLIAPSLSGSVWFTFVILAIVPGFAIMLKHSIEYFRDTGRLNSEEEELWWQDEHAEFVPLHNWGLRFAVTFIVLGSFAFLIGSIIAGIWEMLFGFVGIFYNSAGTTFGGSVVDNLLQIISGVNPIEFIITFALGMLIILSVGIVYLVRFTQFFWENVKLPIRLPQIMSGRRDINYKTQVSEYFDSLGLLIVTTIVILLGPLLIGEMNRLTGIWVVAGLFVVAWVAVFLVPQLWHNTRFRAFVRQMPGAIWYGNKIILPNQASAASTEGENGPGQEKQKFDVGGLVREYDSEGYHQAEEIAALATAGGAATAVLREFKRRQNERFTQNQSDPDLNLIASIPEELKNSLDNLDIDVSMNEALVVRIAVYYSANIPTRPFEEILEDIKITLKGIKESDPERFNNYVKAGKRLVEKIRKSQEENNG